MKITLEGPPQGGKTTVSSVIKERYGLCYVSPTEAVRNAINVHSSTFNSALKQIVDANDVIPDSLLVKVIAEATRRPDCVNGFVMDGFPITRKQTRLLLDYEKVTVDRVVELIMSESAYVARFGGRFFHPASGRMYHALYNPPITPGKDDVTGQPLEQRPEDKPEAVSQRLAQYKAQMDEVKNEFRELSPSTRFAPAEANGNVESVRNSVFQVLDPLYRQERTRIVAPPKKPWWKLW